MESRRGRPATDRASMCAQRRGSVVTFSKRKQLARGGGGHLMHGLVRTRSTAAWRQSPASARSRPACWPSPRLPYALPLGPSSRSLTRACAATEFEWRQRAAGASRRMAASTRACLEALRISSDQRSCTPQPVRAENKSQIICTTFHGLIMADRASAAHNSQRAP